MANTTRLRTAFPSSPTRFSGQTRHSHPWEAIALCGGAFQPASEQPSPVLNQTPQLASAIQGRTLSASFAITGEISVDSFSSAY